METITGREIDDRVTQRERESDCEAPANTPPMDQTLAIAMAVVICLGKKREAAWTGLTFV